ncbi:MAG: TetR family transcriptional regulator [Actinomycetota bacterium]|nr:TetR family transcriptional regulator [Actinomycetota bacterium]
MRHEGAPAPPPVRKSERTRLAILAAAKSQFAEHGYDRTNIRAIAAQARIDPSMVMRYFGNKQSLFAAAVDVDLQLPDLRAVPTARLGRVLTEHFLARWEGELSDDVLVLLLRSAVTNEQAAAKLREIFRTQVAVRLRPVVAPEQLRRRAGLVTSQMLGLALTRYLLGIPGLVERPAADVAADIAPTIQNYLVGPLPGD